MTTMMNSLWELRKPRSVLRQGPSLPKEATSATDSDIPPLPPLPPSLTRSSSRLHNRCSLPPGSVVALAEAPLSNPRAQRHHSRSFSDASVSTRHNSVAATAFNGTTTVVDSEAPKLSTSGNGAGGTHAVGGFESSPTVQASGSSYSSMDKSSHNSAPRNARNPYSTLQSTPSSALPLFPELPRRRRKIPPPPLNPKPHQTTSNSASGRGTISTSQYYIVPKSAGLDRGSLRRSRRSRTTTTLASVTAATGRSPSIKIRSSQLSRSPFASPTTAGFPLETSPALVSLSISQRTKQYRQKQWKQPIPFIVEPKEHQSQSPGSFSFPQRSKSLSRAVKQVGNATMAFPMNGGLGPAAQIGSGGGAISQNNPQAVYQHIVDTTAKRISTLDYLRKSHESRVYWFNTLQFSRPDLLKLPSYSPPKLARRAHNYLLLGFSLPLIIDLNSQTPVEYLKAINSLFTEFEQYQNMHPPDGSSSSSSLSRARIPSMFKRAASSNKSRRLTDASTGDGASTIPAIPSSTSALGGGNSSTSLATTAGSSAPPATNGLSLLNTNTSTMPGQNPSAPTTPHSAHPTSTASAAEPLLPSESYTHLLTPPLPFDPDFFETFATLCDVLIDCYSRITQLITSPESVGSGQNAGLGELFAKADGKVKKVIFGGMMREFEERAREGLRGEVAGVGKVVLGGLMP